MVNHTELTTFKLPVKGGPRYNTMLHAVNAVVNYTKLPEAVILTIFTEYFNHGKPYFTNCKLTPLRYTLRGLVRFINNHGFMFSYCEQYTYCDGEVMFTLNSSVTNPVFVS